MKKLLKYLVTAIVDHPESVKIEEEKAEQETSLKLSVHPEDMGKVIGKGGKIIRSIRSLSHILAVKRKTKLDIKLLEE